LSTVASTQLNIGLPNVRVMSAIAENAQKILTSIIVEGVIIEVLLRKKESFS